MSTPPGRVNLTRQSGLTLTLHGGGGEGAKKKKKHLSQEGRKGGLRKKHMQRARGGQGLNPVLTVY